MDDPIGTDKEGNESGRFLSYSIRTTLIDNLGTESDDVADKVQLKSEKSKILMMKAGDAGFFNLQG